MTAMRKPISYVVIVSGHNLPSLLGILAQPIPPQRVLLLATKGEAFQHAAERLKQVLVNLHAAIDVELLPSNGLSGESMSEMQAWIDAYFMPIYQQHTDHDWILNITGGTKIMPMALASKIEWKEIHYKSFNDPMLQRWTGDEIILAELGLPSISPLDALKTYTNVETGHDIDEHRTPEAIHLSNHIWQFYSQPRDNNPHIALSEQLNLIWTKGRRDERYDQASCLIPWSHFERVEMPVLTAWCDQLVQFCRGALLITDAGLVVPANAPTKEDKHWKDWLAGLWLETLIEHWLISSELFSNNDILKNVKIKAQKRELDFVFMHRANLHVIEAKAAPKDPEQLSEIVRQIKSVTEVGKLTNYLVISPYFEVLVNNAQRMKDFEDNCKANQIMLIKHREQFLAKFKQ